MRPAARPSSARCGHWLTGYTRVFGECSVVRNIKLGGRGSPIAKEVGKTLEDWIEAMRDAEVAAQDSLGKLTARMGELATPLRKRR